MGKKSYKTQSLITKYENRDIILCDNCHQISSVYVTNNKLKVKVEYYIYYFFHKFNCKLKPKTQCYWINILHLYIEQLYLL